MPTMRYLDGVLQKTTSSGTGDLTINTSGGGNFRSFSDAVTAGDFTWGQWIFYVVEDDDNREWGYAQVIEAGPTLKRSTGTRLGSTNAGAAIDCAGAGLTRIFPGIPDEWKLTLQDLAKNGGIIPTTDFENVFAEDNTFEGNVQIDLGLTVDGNVGIGGTLEVDGNATMSGTIYHTKIDTGAEGPNEEAYLDSSSPAASDVIKRWRQYAKDSGGNKTLFSEFLAYVVDPTNGSEDSQWLFRAMVAGAFSDVFSVGGSGAAFGGLTPQGAGTLNVPALYINDVLQTAQTRQVALMTNGAASGTTASGISKIQLSTPEYNTITGASFNNTNDEISLDAGTYWFRGAIASFSETGYAGDADLRLRNTTDGSTPSGTNITIPLVNTDKGGGVHFSRDVTIASTKVFRLEVVYSATSPNHTWSATEPILEIWRVA